MKQIEVTIMGHGYILGCPEGGEALLARAVASVDQEMTHIRDSGKVKARERIAVLAALNLAYQLAERGGSAAASAVGGAVTVTRPPEAAYRSTASAAAVDSDSVDLTGLLQRLDAALADDGQLL